ncbi:MAG: Flp pilus assembly protein CpaB [Deltaproteobacteria bacterium]|nr:Flp pilus assembly protein CpaB [Deltaproteobacteria bacterium]
MELDLQKSRRRPSGLATVGFMVGAVLFAALAGVLVSSMLGKKYATEPVAPVVVALRDLPSGRPLTAQDLSLANWPISAMPRGTASSVAGLLRTAGVTLVPLAKGQPVLASQLAEKGSGLGVASMIPPSMRAMAIRTDDPVALGSLLYPGAVVDVIVTLQRSSMREENSVTTRTVLQQVKVLAVGEDTDPVTSAQRLLARRTATQGNMSMLSSSANDMKGVVTLLVKPDEAERLALASRQGRVNLVMRSPDDRNRVDTQGATPGVLMGQNPQAQVDGQPDGPGAMASGAAAHPEPKSRRSSKPVRRVSRRIITPPPTAKTPEQPKSSSGMVIYRGSAPQQ